MKSYRRLTLVHYMTFAMRDKLENIQILRAVAACMVLASHIGTEVADLAGRRGVTSSFEITPWATGVDVFFVLSGFLMLVTAGDEAGRPGAAAAFMGRRIARIAPLYWLLTTALVLGSLALPGMLHVPIGDAPHVLASYAFWPSLRGEEIRPVLALGWTLEYEMFFYALFALALLLPRGWTVPSLAALMLCVVAAGQVWRPSGVALQFWSSPIILEFLLGVGCAVAYRRGLRLTSAQGGALVAVGLVLLLLSGDAAAQRGSWLPLASVGFPALLVVAGAALSPSARDGAFARIGVEIGAASYSLYLLHPFVLRTLRVVWDRFEPPLGLFWIVSAVLAVIGSILLRRIVEDPINRWAKDLTAGARRRGRVQPAGIDHCARHHRRWTTPCSRASSNGVFLRPRMQRRGVEHEGLVRIEQDEVRRRALGEPALRQPEDFGRSRRHGAQQRRQVRSRRHAPAAGRRRAWSRARSPRRRLRRRAAAWSRRPADHGRTRRRRSRPSASASTMASRSSSCRSGGDSFRKVR